MREEAKEEVWDIVPEVLNNWDSAHLVFWKEVILCSVLADLAIETTIRSFFWWGREGEEEGEGEGKGERDCPLLLNETVPTQQLSFFCKESEIKGICASNYYPSLLKNLSLNF